MHTCTTYVRPVSNSLFVEHEDPFSSFADEDPVLISFLLLFSVADRHKTSPETMVLILTTRQLSLQSFLESESDIWRMNYFV